MSIYDVFSGGSKPFDKEQWAAQKQRSSKKKPLGSRAVSM